MDESEATNEVCKEIYSNKPSNFGTLSNDKFRTNSRTNMDSMRSQVRNYDIGTIAGKLYTEEYITEMQSFRRIIDNYDADHITFQSHQGRSMYQ